MSAKQTIYSTAGDPEYTYAVTITETTGKNISGDVVSLGLSTSQLVPPTAWLPPDLDSSPSPSVRVVRLLVGVTLQPAVGTYYLWYRVTDNPEKPARFSGLRLTIA